MVEQTERVVENRTSAVDPGTRWHSRPPTAITVEGHALMRPVIQRLIEVRRAKGLRQVDIDALIGCADRLTSKYEAGVRCPSINMLAVWCQVLGVALSVEMLGRSGAMSSGRSATQGGEAYPAALALGGFGTVVSAAGFPPIRTLLQVM